MTEQEERITIAKACGWKEVKRISELKPKRFLIEEEEIVTHVGHEMPDYANDLNAMHEAEDALFSRGQGLTYLHCVERLTAPNDVFASMASRKALLRASAGDRARAFINTLQLS